MAEPNNDKNETTLPLNTKVGWGLGTMSVAIGLSLQNMLFLRFMTDFLGVAAATAGLLITASKIYDAITDPIMGLVTDRTSSRFGRRRPYLLLGGALLAISLIAIFNPPSDLTSDARSVYIFSMLLLYATAYTIFNVPYLAMPAEMTVNPHQRSELMTYRIYAVALSGMLASFGGPMIISHFGGGELGHQMMSYILAPVILGASAVAFYATRNAPFTERGAPRKSSFAEKLQVITQNRPFFLLLAIKFCTLLNIGVGSMMPFFFNYVLKLPYSMLGTYFLVVQVTLMVSQKIWLPIGKRFGKRNTYMIALTIAMITPASWLLAGPNEPVVLLLTRAIINGFGVGGVLLMGQSLLPDAIEYDYLKSGIRREGVFAGMYTTVEKISGAVGVAIVGFILGATGYVASKGVAVEQPESAISAIYLCIGLFPIIVDIMGILLLTRFNLSEEKLATMRLTRESAEPATPKPA